MLNPKIEEKAPKLLFGGLITTFYALADINSNANTIEERALVRKGTLSAFSRLSSAFGWLLTPHSCLFIADQRPQTDPSGKGDGDLAKRFCWLCIHPCPYSCYLQSGNRPCLCKSSCLCSRCLRSGIRLGPYNRFGLYKSVFLRRTRRDCEWKCLLHGKRQQHMLALQWNR